MPPPEGDPQRLEPGRGIQHWDNLAERRLDYLTQQLRDMATQLADTAKEMRLQVRAGDQQASHLQRLEERLHHAERELDDIPKRFDRFASSDWAQRIEARLANIEDPNKSPFAQKIEVEPMKKILFGLLASLCAGVLTAVMRIIMK